MEAIKQNYIVVTENGTREFDNTRDLIEWATDNGFDFNGRYKRSECEPFGAIDRSFNYHLQEWKLAQPNFTGLLIMNDGSRVRYETQKVNAALSV